MQRDDVQPGATEAVPDEQLWSWVDRDDPRLALHLADHPEDRGRVDELRRAIRAIAGEDRVDQTPERIGPYPITARLGSGGMGVVFEGTQVRTNRRVAIKVIRGAWLDDERTRRLFFREAEVLARLQHPGIAAIHDAGETKEGAPYFVMELVDGLPLDKWATGKSLGEKLEVARQIAVAVQHAHDKGVIHRDLKPSNVIVTADGTAKVLDFGLARIVDPSANASLTAAISGNVIGTVRYMSPEQARGLASKVTPASDVYSIGVLMYELCTGRLPHDFTNADLFECARKVAEERIEPPSRFSDDVAPALDGVICQALEKDPARRYDSALALAEDIERVQSGMPVHARSANARGEDLGERLGRWGVELGTAIEKVSEELYEAGRSVLCSDSKLRAKKAATDASRRAHVVARRAARQAQHRAHAASQRWKTKRANGETIHIDLNPAIDLAARGAAVAGVAAKGAANVASSAVSGAARGIGSVPRRARALVPSRSTVISWIWWIFAINALILLVKNGFQVDHVIDDFSDVVSSIVRGLLQIVEEFIRAIL